MGVRADSRAGFSGEINMNPELWMSHRVADFFLMFSHVEVIVLIALIGLLWVNRALFFQTSCLSAFDLVVNVALKGTFKVPLALSLHKVGYAFPSGHMQLATVFYVWLALYLPFWWLRVVIACMLAGIGAALIHYGYHDLKDVLGGFSCGLLLIACFGYLLIHKAKYTPWIALVLASGLMVYNVCIYVLVPVHAWWGYGVLCSLIVIERITVMRGYSKSLWPMVTHKSVRTEERR